MSLDPNKTYLVWEGSEFPNSSSAQFKAPAGSSIDWGDGTVESFEAASGTVNTHTYTDGLTEHTIVISGLTSIDWQAFYKCNKLKSIKISDDVTIIYGGAFAYCDSLVNIHIPDGLTTIGTSAFNSCSKLTNMNIPDSVTSIGDGGFYGCNNLTSVTIGNNITRIGNSVFGGCTSLQSIILFAETPPTLGQDVIPSNVQSIYVTQSSKSSYQTATNWNTFASKIISDNLYLSFVRFNQKNKGYIDEKANVLQPKVDETLETESKEIAGAINEVKGLAETARMVFGETEGTAYEGNKGKTNADNIAKLQNEMTVVNVTLEQSGLLKKYKQPITQEYNERITADGLNVLDGSKAVLKKVVGNTVACKNLIKPFSMRTRINKILQLEARDWDGAKFAYRFAFNNNLFNSTATSGDNSISIVGDTVTFSSNSFAYGVGFDCPCVAGKYYSISIVDCSKDIKTAYSFFDGNGNYLSGNAMDGNKYENILAVENSCWLVVTVLPIVLGQEISFSKVQVEEGSAATEYQPYFTGLKSAYFGGIESTNADGTETNTLAFPKTPTPLGTTIDFETKKITDYGVDLVLTGEENWTSREQIFNDVNQFYALLLGNVKYNFGEGVCTDFKRMTGLTDTVGFAIGSDNAALYLSVPKTQITSVDDLKAWLAQRYADGNPVTIRYISSVLQSETDFTADNEYTAYKEGTEKVLDNDGAEYGADNTLTQDYILVTEVK